MLAVLKALNYNRVRFFASSSNYYRAMLRRARYCHGKSSVCPSVTLRYRDDIGWSSSSLECLLSADPDVMDLLQGELPKFWLE